jgi:Uma2 family endonuclease
MKESAVALPKPFMTPEEYLQYERASDVRHEYEDGEIFAMSGASREHNLIANNVSSRLTLQLEDRPCEVYQSDMRVRIPATRSYTYPDVVVVCDPPQFEDTQLDTLLNPTVIVEVLSPSTEPYDRGKKLKYYRRIATLQEYILISQEDVSVEQYWKQGDQWLYTALDSLTATLHLPSLACTLALSSIYQKVNFQPKQGPNP